jgi:gas vesicle protein
MSGYNREYLCVIGFFKKLIGMKEPDLALMIITQLLEKTFDIGEDINLGIVNNVKRIMENMITKLQKEVKAGITNNSEEIKAEIKEVKAEIKAEIKEV